MATNIRNLFSGGASGAAREVRQRFAEQAESLKRAQNLLSPDEVAGDYDAGRLLMTTLGGVIRPLSRDDLRTFQASASALGKRYRGGITAKTVIDHSLPIDRERSNRQIRVAVPTNHFGGDVHFVTNAGPDSDKTRHNVHVRFLDYEGAVASPSKASDAAKAVTAGKLRIQCDCDRWRFTFAYVATVGKYNAGRPQPNFPKIKNPTLDGVACKHLLRVMQQLSSAQVRQFVEKMIATGRRAVEPKMQAVAKKDAEEMARQQLAQGHFKRAQVESSSERRERLAAQRAVKAEVERVKAKMPKTPAQLAVARRKMEISARTLAASGLITQKQLAAMLAKIKGQG